MIPPKDVIPMMQWIQKLRGMLAGRYGLDQLSVALMLLGCAVTFVLSLCGVKYYRLFGLLPMVLALLRVLSRNVARRQSENERFLQIWSPIKNWFSVKAQHAQDADHRYYPCPNCKKTLRVPKNRGKIEITCPHCGTKFKKRT